MNRNLKIAVIGAGIVGANTVIQLQDRFHNADICLMDDVFGENTLSYHPAGIFRASPNFGGMPKDVVRKWLEYSYQYYSDLLSCSDSGVLPLQGYALSNISEENVLNPFLEKILPIYRRVTRDEFDSFDSPWKYGSYYETIRVKGKSFIPWTINKFITNGGKIRKCKVGNFADLENEFHVIFNCIGFQAKYLCNDNHMVPIQGNLITFHAPWITKFYYEDVDSFVVPLGDGNVTIGTSRHFEKSSLVVDNYETTAIHKRCSKLVKSIANLQIQNVWVGLRPYRHIVRLEVEKLFRSIIVHNYGHGGYGIASAPGTSKYVIDEFVKFHSSHQSKL